MILCLGAAAPALTSCGSMHSYWGVEGNYDLGDGPHGNHKPPKPPKKEKHKKPKKHKKNHRD